MSVPSQVAHPQDHAPNWRARLPFYYGWVLAVCSSAVLGLAHASWYSFSVFYVAVLADFGWSRASSAGVYSLFVIVVGVAGAAAGFLVDRFGPGRVIAVGSTILAGGMVACSRLTDLVQFYLFYGVISAIGLSIAGWIPVVTILSRWFSRRYGAALGIASAGIGVGMLVMVPTAQAVISSYGWRTAYLVLAAVAFFGVAPLALLLLRGRPEDYGLLRDGQRPQVAADGAEPGPARTTRVVDKAWVERVWTVGSAMRTPRYWFVSATLALANLASQTLLVHQVAFMVGTGASPILSASIVGLVGLFSVGFKIGWGWLSDRIGRELSWTGAALALVAAISLLSASGAVPRHVLLYAYAVALALGYSAPPPLGPAIAADIFAGKNFGSIYGAIAIANGVGAAIGAWSAGFVYDVTGSYLPAFVVASVAAAAGAGAVWLAAPRKVRRVPGLR